LIDISWYFKFPCPISSSQRSFVPGGRLSCIRLTKIDLWILTDSR
jgi:hypothetical protein